MTEKQEKYVKAFIKSIIAVNCGMEPDFDEFQEATQARMSELMDKIVNAANGYADFEQPLVAASFRLVADSVYNMLSETDRELYNDLVRNSETVVINQKRKVSGNEV